MDLPYSDGPWKLCGLPGVIMKATDSRDLFSFSAIGMEQAKSVIPIVYEKRKFQKVTPLARGSFSSLWITKKVI